MTLGRRIQELRKQNNLSQEALGEKLGVSRQAISRWEMDGAVPEVDKLIGLGKTFGVSLNDLLQVEDSSGGGQPQVVLAPSRGWRLGMVALALLLAVSLGTNALLGGRMAALEDRVTALAEQQAAEAAGLDPAAPLVASFEHDFGPRTERMVDCTAALTAAQMVEGMTVTLQLVDGEGQVQIEKMEHAGGSVYTARFQIDHYLTPITCTALLETEAGAYTQPILRWTSIGEAGWRWDNLLAENG